MTDAELQAWEAEMRSRAPMGVFEKMPRRMAQRSVSVVKVKRVKPPYPDIDITSKTLVADAKARTDAYAKELMSGS